MLLAAWMGGQIGGEQIHVCEWLSSLLGTWNYHKIANQLLLLSCSVTKLCMTLCNPMHCSMPGFRVHHQLLELTQTHVPWVGDVILCRPLLLLPSIFPSIKVFSTESALRIRCPKYWSFSFNINPSNEYSRLISFEMDWLDLLAVQGTLKSLLQHHNSKASILQYSAFFIVQLSHPYITTRKTIALTRRTCWQSNISAFQYAI